MMYISFAALYGWNNASMHAPRQIAAAYVKSHMSSILVHPKKRISDRHGSTLSMIQRRNTQNRINITFQVPHPCLFSEDWKNWRFNRHKMTQVFIIPQAHCISWDFCISHNQQDKSIPTPFADSELAKALSQSLVEWNPSVAKAKKVMWWR